MAADNVQDGTNDHSRSSENLVRSSTMDPNKPVQSFDWANLDQRYEQSMKECASAEESLLEDFNGWIKVSNPSTRFWSIYSSDADL